jgi:hypothetical protein
VLTERGGPDGLWDAQKAGAVAMIHMWPSGEDVIHEMICSPVWGTPTPESAPNLPAIPAASITRQDGLWLRSLLEKGPVRVILRNDAERHWRELWLPVATIRGAREPEKFVLVGGHLDSWYVGITDNATGNACCLELARVFNAVKDSLDRSVRIAWWPGHSYGRYSGSTWFCDNFWQDIHDNCLVYDNIDSPGVLGAIDYSSVTAMPEAKHLAEEVVRRLTGSDCLASRPARAGDQSFWGPGVTSLFMLLSNRPVKAGAAVGGSGGGWWWHSEYDTIDKADPQVLKVDTQIHALALLRLLQTPVLPYRFSPLADELKTVLGHYESLGKGRFDFSPVSRALEGFAQAACQFDKNADQLHSEQSACSDEQREFSNRILRVSRAVNPVIYTRTGPFDQDPATPVPTMPGLHLVTQLDLYQQQEDMYQFTLTRLVRERNRVVAGLLEASRIMAACLK